MKLVPVMADILYDNKEIVQVDLLNKVEHYYCDEKLVNNSYDYITYTHYRPKGSSKGYQLCFKLEGGSTKKSIFELYIEESNYKFKYFPEHSLFVEINDYKKDLEPHGFIKDIEGTIKKFDAFRLSTHKLDV